MDRIGGFVLWLFSLYSSAVLHARDPEADYAGYLLRFST